MNYFNLYMQTEYSMLKSNISISKLSKIIDDNQYDTYAICDTAMHGTIKFYNACVKKGVKPIIGLRCSYKRMGEEDVVLLFSKNNVGYQNLLEIATLMETNPEMSLVDVQDKAFGIIAVMPAHEGQLSSLFRVSNHLGIINRMKEYRNIFDDLYLGISFQDQAVRNNVDWWIQVSKNENIKSVAIHKVNYLEEEDRDVYQTLRCIDNGVKQYQLSDIENNSAFLGNDGFMMTYQNYPQLLDNLKEIKDSCNVTLEFGQYKLPKAKIKQGINSKEYLANLCKTGLNKRLKMNNISPLMLKTYKDRLLRELSIINKMGFNDYFLIVYDYIRFARKENIYVGPGRGSSGGSLVSYSLGITQIDPIEYGLLFERFLNPERISMPDIDVDIEDARRDEVIRYLKDKYGIDRISYITAFSTFKTRVSIRDVARVMELDNIRLKEVLKFATSNYKCIDDAIKDNKQLQLMIERDNRINRLISLSKSIEGLPRNISTHAAGIIIADKKLTSYTPLQKGINGLLQSQYEGSDLESLGLVKMDVLGLGNLRIIKNIIDLIKKYENIDIDINKIPMNDKLTFESLSRAETLGIFQLESAGVRKVLKDLKPKSILDIALTTALYRPGPMDIIPSLIARKNGRSEIVYVDQSLSNILEETYGHIVYQEQIMLIATQYANYTLGEADILRRAISKKKSEDIQKQREIFIEKAVRNNKNRQTAEKVYDYIEKFASYGFNKSHAVSYAVVAYIMSFLKTHFPKAFIASILSSSIGSPSSINQYIVEARKFGLKILSPSINYSQREFTYTKDGIYYSLLGISGVGEVKMNEILEERKKGLFKSFEDFVSRTNNSIEEKIVYSLISAGCFDEMGLTHKFMIDSYQEILNRIKYADIMELKELEVNSEEYTFEKIRLLEKEALGLNIKYDLFLEFKEFISKNRITKLVNVSVDKKERILVVITASNVIRTKNNQEMAFLKVSDDTDSYDMVVFPDTFSDCKEMIVVGNVIYANAMVTMRLGNRQLVCQEIIEVKK